MKYLISLVFLIVPLICNAQMVPFPGPCSSVSAISCNAATDFIGDKGADYAENYDVASGYIMCMGYTATCSSGCSTGTLGYGHVIHTGTASDNGKICVYSDDGDSTPDNDANDLLIACSAEFSSSTNAEVTTAGKLTGSVTCGAAYWVCLAGGASSFKVEYDATGTRTSRIATATFNYTSPQANFTDVDFDNNTASKDMAIWVEIE